ncbi:T9SS C-terminal target domain-containing protein [candidate division KSB1 bacterium]|nr:T9SS type A sorting domain-containing protein [candidate division KSB1 bacterium]RQW01288.1 MAG: T9SS C-terminal target domain-containing protein [candidate division KSB1 bacterium]
MSKSVTVFLMILVLLAADTFARQKRVAQVPNGNKFNCMTCHTSSFGGARNDFGKEVETSFLDANGDVIWGQALAALDSDQDTASNGEELGDPTGEWVQGQANPGQADLVSNPGDPNSTVGVAFAAYGVPSSFTLQNYPNPFNPLTNITFTIPSHTNVTLTIYNSLGEPIRELVNQKLQPGHYEIAWDGQNETGELMSSGVYLARLQSENIQKTIRMLLIK